MLKLITKIRGLVVVALLATLADRAAAQLGTTPPTRPLIGQPGTTAVPPVTPPGPSSATLGTPAFDPYSTAPGAASTPPSLLPSAPSTPAYGTPGYGATGFGTPAYGTPAVGAPAVGTPAYGAPAYGTPAYGAPPPAYGTGTPGYGTALPGTAPPPAYPYPYGTAPAPSWQSCWSNWFGNPPPATGFGTQTPPVLFPNGLYGNPGQAPGGPPAAPGALKLFQHVRASHTWLVGDGGDDLRVNDTFINLTAAMPNFLWTGQPWYLSPGFGLHNWSGPWDGQVNHDLPGSAFSAFLDVGWQSDPNRIVGLELGGRVGVFTDFDHFQSESFRPMGMALLRYNLTPTLALKAGVTYLNRADIKLLPTGGLIWTPNPQTRWEIFFPQPKFSNYLTTLGMYDLWWYVSGEYGGGTWTINRAVDVDGDNVADTAVHDLMDMNDFRVMVGLDFGPPGSTAVGQRGAFFEVGYVWHRDVVFVVRPQDNFTPGSALMLRGGFAF